MNKVIRSQSGSPELLALGQKMQVMPGFVPGLSCPGLRAVITVSSSALLRADGDDGVVAQFLARLDLVFATALPGLEPTHPCQGTVVHGLLQRLLLWTAHIQRKAGMPLFENGRIMGLDATIPCVAVLALATMDHMPGPAAQACNWVIAVINRVWTGQPWEDLLQDLPVLLEKFGKVVPPGSNTVSFLQAAHGMGVPVNHIVGRVYQFGQGARARWLDSSFTDKTPTISATIARNKDQAGDLLRRGGIPVPAHKLVKTEEQAVKVAAQLGYPVVVKPANLDGGMGVAAGLRTEQELKKAFAFALEYSSKLLVEKHVYGSDYRLTVLHGELIWAIERVPGGVSGNGVHRVRELVDTLNLNPNRGLDSRSPLRRLQLDEEALDLLAQEGMTEDSCPAPGQFVRLRRTANVANGGMPVAVFDQVHPDNGQLAVRAARILRLDLAGVDLLIPDISRSWHETGAAICEVNGQPNIGQTTASHLYAVILEKLLAGNGRVPVVMVIGDDRDQAISRALAETLAGTGKTVGYASDSLVAVGPQTISAGGGDLFTAGQALLVDTGVEALIFAVNDDGLLHTGLPFDRVDAMVIAGGAFQPSAGRVEPSVAGDLLLATFVRHMLPSLNGKLYMVGSLTDRVDLKDLMVDIPCARLPADPRVAALQLVSEFEL